MWPSDRRGALWLSLVALDGAVLPSLALGLGQGKVAKRHQRAPLATTRGPDCRQMTAACLNQPHQLRHSSRADVYLIFGGVGYRHRARSAAAARCCVPSIV